jgi:REP element-mobilizing transposase RayT
MTTTYETIARFKRRLPHLERADATYFVTFCTFKRRVLTPEQRDIVLATAIEHHPATCWFNIITVMPDHVHFIGRPAEGIAIATLMQSLKSVSSHRVSSGRLWQPEYFDRILRSGEDIHEKIEYVATNPDRAGLVRTGESYRWTWWPPDE